MAPTRRVRHPLSDDAGFLGVSALLFAASSAVTAAWCRSMSAIGGMEMAGGWTMSMAWMPMPGQTWPGAAASFLGMWLVMMAAMMLPSLVPTLGRYRRAVGGSAGRLAGLTAVASAGYFLVWTGLGLAVYPLGVALSELAMRHPALAEAAPVGAGVVVLMAGLLQLTRWKAGHLACCRETPGAGGTVPATAGAAWRYGLGLGLHCVQCCAGLMSVLLVLGLMDPRMMAAVAAAITFERLAPAAERAARALGGVAVAAGLVLIGRAAGLG